MFITELFESQAQRVLYFFQVPSDVAPVSLKAKGLRNTQSGKWYIDTTSEKENGTLFKSKLKHLETLFGPAKRWVPNSQT